MFTKKHWLLIKPYCGENIGSGTSSTAQIR